ncbi:MAG: DUF2087 domain-containing protein [Negativicutes bacterium]|nr:DUF2087 domain-containing protein [Negativicutes bacterium]
MTDLESLSMQEIVQGYFFDADQKAYFCTDCGSSFAIGEVYCLAERYFQAEQAVQMHQKTRHQNRLAEFLESDSKYLSLTENQRILLQQFGQGYTDHEVAKQLQVSPSTVRHQRFVFREKAKAAKIYLAVWQMVSNEMSKEKKGDGSQLLPVHKGATMVDERYEISEAEAKKIIHAAFASLEPLQLKVFPVKQKKKLVILRLIAQQFEKNKKYTEKEVNGILAGIYADFVSIRRYLIEYGFMDRVNDGSAYWLK